MVTDGWGWILSGNLSHSHSKWLNLRLQIHGLSKTNSNGRLWFFVSRAQLTLHHCSYSWHFSKTESQQSWEVACLVLLRVLQLDPWNNTSLWHFLHCSAATEQITQENSTRPPLCYHLKICVRCDWLHNAQQTYSQQTLVAKPHIFQDNILVGGASSSWPWGHIWQPWGMSLSRLSLSPSVSPL